MGTSVNQMFEDTLTEEECAKKEITLRCRELWFQLQKLQKEIQSYQTQPTLDDSIPIVSSALDAARTTKVAQLSARISALENAKVPLLPENKYLLSKILKSELKSEVNQLLANEGLVRSQRSELAEEIERLTKLKTQLENLKTSLEEKIKVLSVTEIYSSKQVLQQFKEKNDRLKSLYASRLQQLRDFLEKHYPVPTAEQIKDWSKNHNGSKKPVVPLLSLQDIVEQLMMQCLNHPEDPYVTLDDTFWPPYVELLLRCGIASRHPEMSKRVAMTPYHL